MFVLQQHVVVMWKYNETAPTYAVVLKVTEGAKSMDQPDGEE